MRFFVNISCFFLCVIHFFLQGTGRRLTRHSNIKSIHILKVYRRPIPVVQFSGDADISGFWLTSQRVNKIFITKLFTATYGLDAILIY